MKLLTALWLAMWLTPVAGQDSAIDRPHQVMTFSYPMDSSWTMPLWTSRLRPEAKGAIRIARGSIAIDIDITSMTYVRLKVLAATLILTSSGSSHLLAS